MVPGSWLQEQELGKGLCRWLNSGDVDELRKTQAKSKKVWSLHHCEVYCSSSKFANIFLLWVQKFTTIPSMHKREKTRKHSLVHFELFQFTIRKIRFKSGGLDISFSLSRNIMRSWVFHKDLPKKTFNFDACHGGTISVGMGLKCTFCMVLFNKPNILSRKIIFALKFVQSRIRSAGWNSSKGRTSKQITTFKGPLKLQCSDHLHWSRLQHHRCQSRDSSKIWSSLPALLHLWLRRRLI